MSMLLLKYANVISLSHFMSLYMMKEQLVEDRNLKRSLE